MARFVIKAKGLSKYYNKGKDNEVRAIDDLDFEIKKGDFVAIIGPSGSGKSTLLHLLGLLDTPDKGELIIDDHNVNDLSARKLSSMRRKTVGFVFQAFNLIPRTSAYKNVLLPMIYAKMDRKKRKDKTRKLLEMVGLDNRSKHKPNELSGGEKQRVAIARALANSPEIVLADEPTGNLDTVTGLEIMKILEKLNHEGVTVIVVTHDYNIAKKARKIIKLKDGKIAEVVVVDDGQIDIASLEVKNGK